MTLHRVVAFTLALLPVFGLGQSADAQIAITANDNKVVLVNGVVTVVDNPPADTVSVIDLKTSPPRIVGEVPAPVSVVGPPLSVALTPDESLAIVTASNKVDPADPKKQAPDNKVTVIDVKANPPTVLAALEAGKGASGVAINRAGTLALISNLVDGTVSVFTINGKTVTSAATIEVGGAKAGAGMVAITPDGKTALVSRPLDHRISVLSIDGTKVEYTKRDLMAGQRPGVLDIANNGAFAIVGNTGGSASGDHDSVSLIDLTATPSRVVDTIGVLGSTPEGVKIAPDSSVVAVVVHNGSNRPKESPFYNDAGKLVIVRISGTTLARVAEAPIGHWSQGVAWLPDGKTLMVGNMVEKDYWIFSWDGTTLKDTGQRVKVDGGPVAIRTADK